MACCNAMAKLASAALRFPLASHPRDVVADFIVACVVAHAPSSFSQRPIIGHAILGSIDVCFTPESGHVQCKTPCPLWAKAYMEPFRPQALICSLTVEDVVSRQRAANALKCKIADRFNRYVILNSHQHAGANQNLPGLGFVAKPRCD